MSRLLCVGFALILAGCAGLSSLDGLRIPETVRPGAVFVVDHQPEDGRGIDGVIVTALRSHGIEAVKRGQDSGTGDYVVSYIDRWYWDMRTYMVDLRIDVRESASKVLVASARSYQTSLAAMGNTYQEVVQKAVDVLVLGIEAVASEKPAKTGQSNRRRRR